MCGICGYISKGPITEDTLWDMTNAMKHRGPDDGGVWQHFDKDTGYHIGFGHRRLSIFDLSELGHQPMESADGSLTVTYNGEIYNFIELRAELEKKGHKFISNCDTEVLLYAYKEWGDECVSRFNGMFAFALYDKVNSRALFARDRMGKKPLYYYHHNQTFIFGSEIKALMKHPAFVKDIDYEMISAYLANKYYHSPFTVFKDTYKLEPGHTMVLENDIVKKRPYWDLLQTHMSKQKALITDESEAKAGLKKHLHRSVEQRLAADVPVGVFLSAGIDSVAIAGTAVTLSEKPVKTFTIGFFETERNEADRAKIIAEHLGTDHTELYVTQEDILSLTADIPEYFDEPFSDFSQLPTMLVSKLARQDVTVALSGDGGDELFCGYEMYDWTRRAQKTDAIGAIVNSIISLPGISKLRLEKLLPNTARALVNNRNPDTKVQLFSDVREEVTHKIIKGSKTSAKFEIEKDIITENWQEKRMLLDMLTYLPDEVLSKADRASMRYALELRCPLMDVNLVEYSFSVPMSMKYKKGCKKWLLKQVAYDYVPEKLLDMPKRGFGVPAGKWLRGPLGEMVQKYSNRDVLDKQGVFIHDAMTWLIGKVDKSDNTIYSTVLWSFLVFQLWYQQYIEDLW